MIGAMVEAKTRLTADDLLRMRDDGFKYELRRGELIKMPPAGDEHGEIGMTAGRFLGNHVYPNKLGSVFNADTGFRLESDPDTVRAPDVGFISRERRPPRSQGYLLVAPDLAVEVVSPNDSASDVQEKVAEYLAAGSRLVWVVYPRTRSVVIYRANGTIEERRAGQTLEGEDVVPGFSCAVAELFPAD
jgi:Uma2 family endonuclease